MFDSVSKFFLHDLFQRVLRFLHVHLSTGIAVIHRIVLTTETGLYTQEIQHQSVQDLAEITPCRSERVLHFCFLFVFLFFVLTEVHVLVPILYECSVNKRFDAAASGID